MIRGWFGRGRENIKVFCPRNFCQGVNVNVFHHFVLPPPNLHLQFVYSRGSGFLHKSIHCFFYMNRRLSSTNCNCNILRSVELTSALQSHSELSSAVSCF